MSKLPFLVRFCISCRWDLDQAKLFSSRCSVDPVDHGYQCGWALRKSNEAYCRSHQGRGWKKLMHNQQQPVQNHKGRTWWRNCIQGISPKDRTTETCGWRKEEIRWWSGYFSGVEHNFTEGSFQMIASESPTSSWRFLSCKKVLRVSPRNDRYISCLFISEKFLHFKNSWSEILQRS